MKTRYATPAARHRLFDATRAPHGPVSIRCKPLLALGNAAPAADIAVRQPFEDGNAATAAEYAALVWRMLETQKLEGGVALLRAGHGLAEALAATADASGRDRSWALCTLLPHTAEPTPTLEEKAARTGLLLGLELRGAEPAPVKDWVSVIRRPVEAWVSADPCKRCLSIAHGARLSDGEWLARTGISHLSGVRFDS